jgi:RHS repeat-associated protein
VTKVVNGGTTLTYKFDGNGNDTQSTDPTGTTTTSFDAKDRVTSQTLPGQSIPTTHTYDGADRLATLTDAGGTVQYGYDNDDELTSVIEPGGPQTTIGYNANGNRTTTAYPGGITMINTYAADSGGHLTPRLQSLVAKNSAGSVLTSYTYSNQTGTNDTDLWQSVTDKSNNVTKYTYDLLNRVGEANTMNGSSQVADYKYSYDPSGNILSAVNGSATTTFTYNAANELCWSLNNASTNGCSKAPRTGATTYSYDAGGNQTTDSGNSLAFAYNGLNQTTSVTPNGGTALTFSYRSSGQSSRAGAGGAAFTDNSLGLGSSTTGGNTTYYTRDTSGRLISERTPGGSYYYLFDGLGSVVGLTSASGALSNTYAYDPYGNTTSSTGTVTNPWRFAGAYLDSSTGLYKIGARYYNPALGRWTQQDPLEQPDSLINGNRYAYVGDNPVNDADPSGMTCSRYAGDVPGRPTCQYPPPVADPNLPQATARPNCQSARNNYRLECVYSRYRHERPAQTIIKNIKSFSHNPVVVILRCANGIKTGNISACRE